MISASKSTLSLKNLKILRPKVTKNLTNLHKKFWEFPPWLLIKVQIIIYENNISESNDKADENRTFVRRLKITWKTKSWLRWLQNNGSALIRLHYMLYTYISVSQPFLTRGTLNIRKKFGSTLIPRNFWKRPSKTTLLHPKCLIFS